MLKSVEIKAVKNPGTISRDSDDDIESVDSEGMITTIVRDVNGDIESVTHNDKKTTIQRDGDGNISGWTVEDV